MSDARWIPYGEAAVYLDLDLERAPDRAARTHAAAAALRAHLGGRAAEVVVGAGALVVIGPDPALDPAEALAAALAGARGGAALPGSAGRTLEIPVVYDGPDLAEVAAAIGAAPAEVIALHTGREVVVELLGFMPGFAYCSGIDARLVRPRRSAPRPSVPPGSVAIAGEFTGIYPFTSPGGWWLLGRAAGVTPFDPERDPPALFAPGDRVRFVAVEDGAVAAAPPAPPPPAAQPAQADAAALPALHVVAAPAAATVQDAGRTGQLSRGLPPSGPLDVETHAAANAAAGNPAGAAAIEIPLGALEVQAAGEVVVSVDGEPARRLRDGERLRVDPGPSAVRYLAVRGGVAVPAQLGARATLMAARLGGLGGRPLRRGDRIPVDHEPTGTDAGADAGAAAGAAAGADTGDKIITLAPGPHLGRFPAGAMDALLAPGWRISRLGDRVGVRLEGGRVPREGPDLALPAPMIRGAVQVTTDGTPIVLGPDHPVTGGYPVIAVVRREDQPRLARLRSGDAVRFRLGR